MMYLDKFVVAIKANDKILRETKDLVHLPFGSEFTVLVKNLNSRRAKFTLHIDGTDVLSGEEIIVNANSEVEMKRFIRNGNMDEGNAFKFIERTQAIEDGPRGIKVDDGIVRVEFWFEQEAPVTVTTTHYHKNVWWDEYYKTYPYGKFGGPYYGQLYNGAPHYGSTAGVAQSVGGSSLRSSDVKNMVNSAAGGSTASFSTDSATLGDVAKGMQDTVRSYNATVNDAGITVPGSKVEQKFTAVYGFKPEAISHVVILRIVGMVGEVEVVKPITVKSKQKCETCGKVNKATSKFCTDCGTALELL